MAKKSSADKSSVGPGKRRCVCGEICGVRTKVCSKCGYEFPVKTKTQTTTPKATTSNTDLKSALLAKKAELEDLLENRDRLVAQLKSIDDLLDTM